MEVVEGQPVPPYDIDHPFDSFGISEVIESKNSKFPASTLVTSPFIKWEERSVVPANATSLLTVLPPQVRDSTIPLSAYISVLGMHVSFSSRDDPPPSSPSNVFPLYPLDLIPC